jgi:hypothetical protein
MLRHSIQVAVGASGAAGQEALRRTVPGHGGWERDDALRL